MSGPTPEFVAEANARTRGKPMDLHVPPERHWDAMRSVDKVIVLGMRAFASGIRTPNEYVAEYACSHPEKVIEFAGVDPSVENDVGTLEQAVAMKLRGVKLGPICQNLHPCDPKMLEVYAFCEKHGLPVMMHQGTTFPRKAPLKYALPILLEDVALQFPYLKFALKLRF